MKKYEMGLKLGISRTSLSALIRTPPLRERAQGGQGWTYTDVHGGEDTASCGPRQWSCDK